MIFQRAFVARESFSKRHTSLSNLVMCAPPWVLQRTEYGVELSTYPHSVTMRTDPSICHKYFARQCLFCVQFGATNDSDQATAPAAAALRRTIGGVTHDNIHVAI